VRLASERVPFALQKLESAAESTAPNLTRCLAGLRLEQEEERGGITDLVPSPRSPGGGLGRGGHLRIHHVLRWTPACPEGDES
jgi:hypothetical protein